MPLLSKMQMRCVLKLSFLMLEEKLLEYCHTRPVQINYIGFGLYILNISLSLQPD